MKFLYALALVPEDKVIEAFQLIVADEFFVFDENNPHSTEILIVVDYFESTYIGRAINSKGARRKPMFPMSFWNIHQLILNGKLVELVETKYMVRMF